jgi:hypothetical protein
MAKKKSVRALPGLPSDPDANWNDPEPNRLKMLLQCERIIKKIQTVPLAVHQRPFRFL